MNDYKEMNPEEDFKLPHVFIKLSHGALQENTNNPNEVAMFIDDEFIGYFHDEVAANHKSKEILASMV